MPGKMTTENHHQMDQFLGELYDSISQGKVDRTKFIGGLAHVMAALDKGNVGEALNWFKSGDRRFTLDDSKLSGSDRLG